MTPPLTPAQRRVLLTLPKDRATWVCFPLEEMRQEIETLPKELYEIQEVGPEYDDWIVPPEYRLTERGQALRAEIENAG